jgi:hypothetical protein
MANVIELNWKPDERTLRHFGFIAVAGFGLLAVSAWFEILLFAFGLGGARSYVSAGFGLLAALSGGLSLFHPRGNRPIYVATSLATYPIGFALSYLILGTLFYAIIAPVGLVLRLFGRDPLERRILPEADSYWVDVPASRPRVSYFKQF